MKSCVTYYFAAVGVIVIHNLIFPLKGQSTIQDSEVVDSSSSVVGKLNAEEIRSLKEQVQRVSESFQEIKSQLDNVLRRFGAIDQSRNEHDTSIRTQTPNSSDFEIGIFIQPEIGVHLKDGLVLLPSVNNWIVLMHRFDGSVNFYRNWTEYRNGFGYIGRGEFWLGNEKIHRLTNTLCYGLRIEVQLNTSGRWFYADYTTFSLDSESNKYAIRISGYSGNAGDSLTNTSLTMINGTKFTTSDADNDRRQRHNCASYFQGSWWFDDCWYACLTCHYHINFRWYYYGGWQSSGALRAARMMIKSI